MTTTSYRIHLPTGSIITARNSTELDKILSLNVCRVYQGCQIRIEPVFHTDAKHSRNIVNRQAFRRFASLLTGVPETDI